MFDPSSLSFFLFLVTFFFIFPAHQKTTMGTLDIKAVDTRPKASLFQILLGTLCMAGIQFTWTVELSYGTPYLLSLDLSKELTACVWLAGPLSGLIVQPLVGAWSDKNESRQGRRRPFIIGGGALVCLSLLCVAYSKQIAAAATTDPDLRRSTAIAVAVTAFYILDFSLNAVQASCRSLILDIFPIFQQDTANAFASNIQNITNVFGYFIGFVDLVKYVPGLGHSQMEAYCTAGVIVFISAMAVTCLAVNEVPYQKTQDETSEPWYQVFLYVWRAFRQLQPSVQKLCNVIFFAWMGWFPFLFYSTTWVSSIYFDTHQDEDPEDSWDKGARAGSLAMLLYAIFAVISGTALPTLTANGFISLKNTYTLSHVISATALLSTIFVRSVAGATALLGLMGISFACAMWIPFALVGEYLVVENKQNIEEAATEIVVDNPDGGTSGSNDDNTNRQRKTSNNNDINYGAISGASTTDETTNEDSNQTKYDAGMVLGVLNIYVVLPQFLTAFLAAIIFAVMNRLHVDQDDDDIPNDNRREDTAGVTAVLFFGGLMAVIAAILSRRIVDVQTKSKSIIVN
ncbi:major facilitator superfamily domain-containing protein [Phascolomyces articulosus]|uniref:Major facilitator superfamily domain-containing protein n=1 Tax=Phascolomyces articulosus TaxID=60185 RepID=A0AAD5P7L3_9FUNG|nr:major facilitator superfamily domain-containing protein [Phascolomyces articulosus]